MSASRAPRGDPRPSPSAALPALASQPGHRAAGLDLPDGRELRDPAVGRTLNPNNPYAAAFAGDPANGAARLYYLFGDIPAAAIATTKSSAGAVRPERLDFGDDWNWRVEGVYARDNLSLTNTASSTSLALANAINTGSYNFVDPSKNTAAVRNALAPQDHDAVALVADVGRRVDHHKLWTAAGRRPAAGRRRPGA
jgi:iron complex outermembrane receptor protein